MVLRIAYSEPFLHNINKSQKYLIQQIFIGDRQTPCWLLEETAKFPGMAWFWLSRDTGERSNRVKARVKRMTLKGEELGNGQIF